ncbi:hypothetical protein B0T19DRAFT_351283 [Cercophora scortea]|uniref:Uncharacterized protein n=1 Tax=Cercophora scortea TaxID=314031 RepID=A0AAE0MKS8_9PEZI|nr:hypothetical protein B0T19DRAFT_351283 [Cercophora scortea]
MASFNGQPGVSATNKLTKIAKTRTKAKVQAVKPILKKLSQTRSEKNSLDLNRGWEDQSVEQLDNLEWASESYLGRRSYSARDVSFALSNALGAVDDGSVGTGAGTVSASGAGGGSIRTKFQHNRSTSQASTGSGPRGAFVHPFQQTPRGATPPLSYANSTASFDNVRDCSPTITENEDDDEGFPHVHSHSHSHSHSQSSHHTHHHHHHHHHHHRTAPLPSVSQTNLRRPSLASQRTTSNSDITSPPAPLRSNTSRSAVASSRLAHGSLSVNTSQSDLQLNPSVNGLDSPTGSIGGTIAPPSLASPNSSGSAAQMSPIRSSLEAAGFPRLRSRSELDAASRAEGLRAARRRFEERERAKEEKYDREMIKKRERRDNREATRIEKESAGRKSSLSIDGLRPSATRKTTPNSLSTASATVAMASASTRSAGGSLGKNDSSVSFWGGSGVPETGSVTTGGGGSPGKKVDDSNAEKQMEFVSRKYESVPGQAPPAFGTNVDDVRFEPARPRRTSTAKRRTQTYWAGFVLWLRTKLLRLGSG